MIWEATLSGSKTVASLNISLIIIEIITYMADPILTKPCVLIPAVFPDFCLSNPINIPNPKATNNLRA